MEAARHFRWRRSSRRLAALALALFAGACATPGVFVTVTRFHDPAVAEASTFVVEPASEPGGLEFRRYAALVGEAMKRQGYVRAAPGNTADLRVFISYGVSGGRSEIVTVPPTPTDWYWREIECRGLLATVPCPPPNPAIQTWVVHDRWFEVRMTRRSANGEDAAVFEGRAVSEGSSAALPEIAPALIEALFVDFPGVDGETRGVHVVR